MSEERLERIEQKLDVLADSIGGLGVGVYSRLAQVDERFNQVDERLAQVDAGISSLVQKTDRIERKVDSIEDTQRHINNELSEHLQRHERRIGALEDRRP